MKILLPEIEIKSDTGFSSELDIFRRKDFGERLAKLIENTNDNPVIALDSGWGEGKSTFIKMWRGYLEHHREEKIKTIYFDAFENDFQKDPFLTLASEIYSLIEDVDEEKKQKFIKKATNAAKSLMRGAIKISVKAATAGVVDGTTLDAAEKELSNLVASEVDNIIADKFKNVETDKLALNNFKKYLQEFSDEIGNGKPIVFIIDELDRCKPSFALDLLEQVKHLFAVKGITFLLVTNRAQLEESIRNEYGKGVNATNYLHKFVNLWLSLPKEIHEYHDYRIDYLKYAISKMCGPNEPVNNNETIEVLKEIIKFYNLSLREIERLLSYFAIAHNTSGNTTYISHYQYLMAFVCYLGSAKPLLLKSIDNMSYTELIEKSGLSGIDGNTRFYTLYLLKISIKFDLSNDDTKKQMIENREIDTGYFGRTPQDVIKKISSWVSEIDTSK